MTITFLLFMYVISRAHDRFSDPPSSKLVIDQHCLWDPLQVSTLYIYLSEFARRWPLKFSLEYGRKPLWPLKRQGACRQGLLFQAAQGQF